jgi:hypothetical protein
LNFYDRTTPAVNKEHGLKFGDERYTIIKMRSVFVT